jgi:lipid II:glycine glycyltransferase (peptidoglycan interpeptide bridge formation enzyme)
VSGLLEKFSLREDIHQSAMYAKTMQEIGWHVEGKPGSTVFYKTLGPLTISKIQRPKKVDLEWLKAFRKKHHTLTTYIEPGLNHNLSGVHIGKHVEPFAHSATSILNIAGSDKSIINSFSQKTRYNITRTLKKNDLRVISTKLGKLSSNLEKEFLSIHKEWAQRKHVMGHGTNLLKAVLKSYKEHGEVHLCYLDQELIASLLVLYHDSVATYYAATSTPLGYKSFGPTLLTWVAIQQARKNNCDIFDFGGIYDPRYPKMYKGWQGFTKFKSGFNPEFVSYSPTYLQLFW